MFCLAATYLYTPTFSTHSFLLADSAVQETNCVVVDVPVDSEEFRGVAMRFHTSLKESRYHVIRIERIQVSAAHVDH